MRRINNRNIFHRLVVITILVFTASSIITTSISEASNPYPAFNELGHSPIDYTNGNANNGDVTGAIGFLTPIGIAMDTTNHWLFVAEAYNNRVLVFDLDSNNVLIDRVADHVLGQELMTDSAPQRADADGMHYPDVVAYDNTNSRLFISDGLNFRIMVFDLSGGITDGMNSSYILGGVGALAANTTDSVNGMAYDNTTGLLYAADSARNRVLIFDVRSSGSAPVTYCGVTTTGIVNSMNASCVIGQDDFVSNQVTGTSNDDYNDTLLIFPVGLYLDEDSDLLYVTSDNISIRVFDVSTLSNGQAATKVLGVPNFTTGSNDYLLDVLYDPGVTAWSIVNPRGMVMDEANDILYLADTGHNRILGFDVTSITNGEDAVSVIGQSDFISGDPGTTQTAMSGPQWTAWHEPTRTLYQVESGNNRVLLFKIIGISSTTLTAATTGASYTGTIPVTNDQGTVSFEVLSGSIPTGMSLNSTGLTGTPTLAGAYSFTLRAVDTVGTGTFYSNHQSYSITVNQGTGGGGNGGPPVFECNDTFDNDGDGLVDTLDPDCHSDGNAADPLTYVTTLQEVSTPTQCTDMFDNDNDGLFDYPGDPGCTDTMDNDETDTITPPVTQCSDSLDNDADGKIDYPADPGCLALSDNSEIDVTPPLPPCSDGIDNDADGKIDFPTDPGCDGPSDITEDDPPPSSTECNDGVDNDGDGTIDYPLDSGCSSSIDNTELSGTICSDPLATNYMDGGVCIYPPPTTCSDPAALNFGSVGSCTYSGPTTCMDTTATNYGAPGSCTYPITPTCATNPSLCPTPPTTTGGTTTVGSSSTGGTSGGGSGGTGGTIPVDTIQPVVSAISGWGALIAGITTVLNGLFAAPIALAELGFIPQRLWEMFLGALGYKKRYRKWGVVYDSITKQPLDPAYVVLSDQNGKEIATSITDLDGRYGFLVSPGKYRITAQKTNYTFPSDRMKGHQSDEVYKDLYFGDVFEIKDEGDVIVKNIPLDPINFDWNEFMKKQKNMMRFNARRDAVIRVVLDGIFVLGFLSTIVALVFDQSVFNFCLLGFYIILLSIRYFGKIRKAGIVAEKNTKSPLAFGILRVHSLIMHKEFMTRVLDKNGRYYALLPNGSYYISIDKKNMDGTYKKVYQSDPFEVKTGIIDKKYAV